MGWLIAVAVMSILLCIPIGVWLQFDSDGFVLKVTAGFIRYTVIPIRRKTEKKTGPQTRPTASKTSKKQTEKRKDTPSADASKGGKVSDFIPMMRIIFRFMNSFRKKLRIDYLSAKILIAGEDPCDVAVNYGRAWIALGNLLPRLERFLAIKKREINIMCDFEVAEPLIVLQLALTITIGRLLSLAAVYGFQMLKELFMIKKRKKGGAVV